MRASVGIHGSTSSPTRGSARRFGCTSGSDSCESPSPSPSRTWSPTSTWNSRSRSPRFRAAATDAQDADPASWAFKFLTSAAIRELRRLDPQRTQVDVALRTVVDLVVDDVEQDVHCRALEVAEGVH